MLPSDSAALNARFRHHSATDVLTFTLHQPWRVALVSSFGAESVVLLHMLSVIDRRAPVIFIDTLMLFAQTLDYQHELAERLRLENITVVRADDIALHDPDGSLHLHNPDACCRLRKVGPLHKAMTGFDGRITGRKRYQGKTRTALEFFETDGENFTINPLAHWDRADTETYITENRLPRHPLAVRGYPSIGCAPCTLPVQPGEDMRAGRWRGQDKTECGIHFSGGKVTRVTT